MIHPIYGVVMNNFIRFMAFEFKNHYICNVIKQYDYGG